VRIACDAPRALARRLAGEAQVQGLIVDEEHGELVVTTRAPHALFAALPGHAHEAGVAVAELYSSDESLDAVFGYLVGGGR